MEALIAMAVLAAALLPLLDLQSQFVRSVDSLQRADSRFEARENGLAYFKTLNLYLYPTGEVFLGDVTLRWQAVPAGASKMSRGNNGVVGRYEITLYDVECTLIFGSGAADQFKFRGLGWRATRPFIDNTNR